MARINGREKRGLRKGQGLDPRLRAWLDEYDSIYADFLAYHRRNGVAFGSVGKDDAEIAAVLRRLKAKGALFRNGCASVSANGLSTACEACTGHPGSKTFFISLRCPRNCYFCFNRNQENYERYLASDRDWLAEFDQIQREGLTMTHIGLTGGEPLLDPDKAVDFFEEARRRWPDAHLRLYTSGWGLDAGLLGRLKQAGVNEIRVSVKLDEGIESCREALTSVGMVAASGEIDAMVEMPVIPGSEDQMKRLLLDLDAMGAFGVNLLEFCYPLGDWSTFGSRGFKVKNPPFPVLYDWAYAGGLPIEGSELECLRLIEFAVDEDLRLSVHYCSLENKHRDQVLTQNSSIEFEHPCYELDPTDFFFKTCKAYGDDALAARNLLQRRNLDGWDFDASDNALSAHPSLSPLLRSSGIEIAISCNVLEIRGGIAVLRELALKR